MNNTYHSNYYNSIHKGLLDTVFFIDNQITDSELFFLSINELLDKIRKKRKRIYFFGNGASASFANHMALDFSKNGKILSRSLSDNALLTALSNDYSYDLAMVEFLKIEEINKEDLIITISSSGNSPNIVNVLNYCKENKIETLGLSGLKKDNQSNLLSKYSIYVPMKTYGIVECIHQIFLHLILDQSMGIFEWNRNDFQNMNIKNFKL